MKKLLLFTLLLFATIESIVAQSAGFNSSYAVFSINGAANAFYCMPSTTSCGANPSLNTASLGSFSLHPTH
jgi:hypothetical protein